MLIIFISDLYFQGILWQTVLIKYNLQSPTHNSETQKALKNSKLSIQNSYSDKTCFEIFIAFISIPANMNVFTAEILTCLITRCCPRSLQECYLRACAAVSEQPHGLQSARLFCLWNSPGKKTIVGCHFLLQGIFLTQISNPSLMCPAMAGGFFTTSATCQLRPF